ncbi:MAG: hypothetical protein ACRC62_29545 [Microcoleus sp.]
MVDVAGLTQAFCNFTAIARPVAYFAVTKTVECDFGYRQLSLEIPAYLW